jgi:hypothetical protein
MEGGEGMGLRELDSRTSGGVMTVTLLWERDKRKKQPERTVIRLEVVGTDTIEFDVEPDEAAEAFRHPFVYAPQNAVEAAASVMA